MRASIRERQLHVVNETADQLAYLRLELSVIDQ
jgi:hypothetical protein